MKAHLRQIASAFERLSSREQVMVLSMMIALLGAVFGYGSYYVGRDLAARQRRIESKTEKLREIAALRSSYQKKLAEQQRVAGDVKRNGNVRILSYLEELSRQSRIDLGNAAERAGEPTGSEQVREEGAEVMVTNVSLDRLHDFLKRIEENNALVKVRRLKIKTRFDNKEMLDASITVGTYKPTSG